MARQHIAHVLPHPLPALPTQPHPASTPLQNAISSTLNSTDYDSICVPLTNPKWQERWERLCLRAMDEEDESAGPESDAMREQKERAREAVDREADIWRKEGGLKREEVVVSRLEETQNLIGIASEWLELDAPDEGIRFDSELALRAEVAQALYLAVPVLILPAPNLANRAYLPSYARAIANILQIGGPSAITQISIRIPVSDPVELIHQGPAPSPSIPTTSNNSNGYAPPPSSFGVGGGMVQSSSTGSRHHKRISSLSTRPTSFHQAQLASLSLTGGGGGAAAGQPSTPQNNRVSSATGSAVSAVGGGNNQSSGDPSSTWEMWDCIRTLCGYHPRLSVTLDLTNPLPPSVGALSRWTAEPLKNIWLPASSFIPNGKGYPVLSKACQAFLRGMSKQNPTFILAGTTLQKHSAGGPLAYLQYVRHITSTPNPPSAPSQSSAAAGTSAAGNYANLVENGTHDYAAGYGDYLQAPLQPLMDDLGSATYDVFERDPVKYRQYEEAIFLALSDLPSDINHVVTVVGAGRGPLVTCTLKALQRSSRRAKVYAVEKNANAFVTLQEKKALEWQDKVDIIYGDMRTLVVPEQADIVISELLGSFGDNELSPECLDGAMRFLKPTGISIPASYTAHIAPISSSKLHHDVTLPTRPPGAAETPYVVMLQQVNLLSGDGGGVAGRCGERIQQCWNFEHPRRDLILDSHGAPLTNSHNTRSSTHTFHIPHASTLHGLAGYFESHLYANIGLSIHPENMHRVSPDMFSWFPLFFPLKEPLYLPSGAELDVNLWRLVDGKTGKKVWYEWCCEAWLPVQSPSVSAGGMGSGGSFGGGLNGNGIGSGIATGGGSRIVSGTSGLGIGPGGVGGGSGGGQPSPMMDAPLSPSLAVAGLPGPSGEGRIKIGQTSLHNPGGIHSWVGL